MYALLIKLVHFLQHVGVFVGIFFGQDARVAFLQYLQNLINFLNLFIWVLNHLPESCAIFYSWCLSWYFKFGGVITLYYNSALEYFFNLIFIKEISIAYYDYISSLCDSMTIPILHAIILYFCFYWVFAKLFMQVSILIDHIYETMEYIGGYSFMSTSVIVLYSLFLYFFFFIIFIFLFSLMRSIPYEKKKKYFNYILKYFKIDENFNTPPNFYIPILKYKHYIKINSNLSKSKIGGSDFKLYSLEKLEAVRDLSSSVGDPFSKSLVVHKTAQNLSFNDKINTILSIIILLLLFIFPILCLLLYILNLLGFLSLSMISLLYGIIFFAFIPHYKISSYPVETRHYVPAKRDKTVLKTTYTPYNMFTTTLYLFSLNLNKNFVCLIYWIIDLLCDFYYLTRLFLYIIFHMYLFSITCWLLFAKKSTLPFLLIIFTFYVFFDYFFSEDRHLSKKSLFLDTVFYIVVFLFIYFLFIIKLALPLILGIFTFSFYSSYAFKKSIALSKEKRKILKKKYAKINFRVFCTKGLPWH
jgi:hypothetical protein